MSVTSHADDPINALISRNIGVIRAYRRMTQEDLYTRVGMTKGTWFNRLRGRNVWTASEVAQVAGVLGVDAGVLYSKSLLPQVDSNHQPADYQLALAA